MKNLHYIKVMMIALMTLLFLFGCEVPEDLTISSVVVDQTLLVEPIEISDFSLSDLELIVTYSDGSEVRVVITESMIESLDLAKLSIVGEHDIVVTYMGFTIPITIELINQAMTDLLTDYYDYAVESLGFIGTYQAWIDSLSIGQTRTIINAILNSQNELIITFSDQSTLNLGMMQSETYTVTFFGFNGILIQTVTVPRGGTATAPVPLSVVNYNFIGWDIPFTNVQNNLEVYAIYQYAGTPVAGLDNADELLISLDRLENAQFEIDLDTIFSEASETQSTHRSRTLSSILNQATTLDVSDPYDPENYIPHTYWQQYLFHKNLYQMPAIIDGYHVITQTLTSYNSHALNNLYDVTGQVTSQARSRADWAVDHLTVVDTWVTQDDFKYLLHYDEELDRVELYTIWAYAPSSITSYEKIYVYYNANGEEVIENWVEQIYTDPTVPGYPGVLGYHNSVAGRDFNYYAIWLDEQYLPREDMHHYRGINLNDEGFFEYYDNNMHMVSGDYGWYTIQPGIDDVRELIYYPENPIMTVYSPDASTDVLTIYPMFDGGFIVDLCLPSMNGVEALLVEEGGMYQENQDSESTQAFLIDEGFQTMPDWWVMDVWDVEVTAGFRTSKGSYYGNRGSVTGDVTLQSVRVIIGSEGYRDYDYYHNYYGMASLYVDATTIAELVEMLTVYFEDVGLIYKFGDTALLFNELGYVYENHETIGRKISVMNDVMGGPADMYGSFEQLVAAEAFITNYLSIRTVLIQMVNDLDEISFSELPSKNDLDAISLIDTSSHLTGSITMPSSVVNTSGLVGTLNQSPLLQNNQSYSIYYALQIGGKLIELNHEIPQVYTGQTLTFNGNLSFQIPGPDLDFGQYQLVAFFGKVTPDGFLRISNPVPWNVNDYAEFSWQISDPVLEVSRSVDVYLNEGILNVSVYPIDGFAPKISIENDEEIYQWTETIDELEMPLDSTVEDLLKKITIIDNVDGELVPTVDMITKNGEPVLITDLLTQEGYKITVTDSSGKQTEVTITLITFGYLVTWMSGEEVYLEEIVQPGTTITSPEYPTKEGHTFVSWDTTDFLVNGNRIINAIYSVNSYTITWMYQGAVYETYPSVEYGAIINMPGMEPMVGHDFVWDNSFTTMPGHDLIITGDYVKTTYYITYYLDGLVYAEQGYLYGDTITYPVPTLPDGFTFSGWSVTLETMPDHNFSAEGTSIPTTT